MLLNENLSPTRLDENSSDNEIAKQSRMSRNPGDWERTIYNALCIYERRRQLAKMLETEHKLVYRQLVALLVDIVENPESDHSANRQLIATIAQHPSVKAYFFPNDGDAWNLEEMIMLVRAMLSVSDISSLLLMPTDRWSKLMWHALGVTVFSIDRDDISTTVQQLCDATDLQIYCSPPTEHKRVSDAWALVLLSLAESGRLGVAIRDSHDMDCVGVLWSAREADMSMSLGQKVSTGDAAGMFVLALLSKWRALDDFVGMLTNRPRLQRMAQEMLYRQKELALFWDDSIRTLSSTYAVLAAQSHELSRLVATAPQLTVGVRSFAREMYGKISWTMEECTTRQEAIQLQRCALQTSSARIRACLRTTLFDMAVALQQVYSISAACASNLPSFVLLTIFRYADLPYLAYADHCNATDHAATTAEIEIACRIMDRATNACVSIYKESPYRAAPAAFYPSEPKFKRLADASMTNDERVDKRRAIIAASTTNYKHAVKRRATVDCCDMLED